MDIREKNLEINDSDIKQYSDIGSVERKIKPASEFAPATFDYFHTEEKWEGAKLPIKAYDNKFRLRAEELTVLAGINGAGKSLFASQCLISAMDQGFKCLSVSLEMSPKSQLARMWRQASLQASPTLEAGLQFTKWSNDKLWFYDQHGTINPKNLVSVLRYAYDKLGINIVLVDSLMTMSMNSDDWNGQKQVVQALANTARHLGIHIILVCHARKGQSVKDRLDKWSIAGSSDITNRADNVIILGRLFDEPDDAYLSLCKARHFDGAEMDLDLKLDLASMNYYHDGQLPKGVLTTPAKGGIMGELDRVALNETINENIILKTKRPLPATMGSSPYTQSVRP
jgi:twinkle protein